jgi:type IV pilus assembly protein PilB
MFKFKNSNDTRLRNGADFDDSTAALKGLSNLYDPQEHPKTHVRDLADVLLELGKIDDGQLAQVRQKQQAKGGCEAAVILQELRFVGEEDILRAKASLCGLEFRHVEPEDVQKEMFGKLEKEYIRNNLIMPIAVVNEKLVVATSRPSDVFVIDDVRRRTGMNVEVIVSTEADILKVCETIIATKLDYNVDAIIEDATQGEVQVIESREQESEDLEKMAGESPIIKFVNYLISHAIRQGASDIHIEPKEDHTKIRFRIDGILFDAMKPPQTMHSAVISRIKIMSNLDISERRIPQDGRIAAVVGGQEIDLRVSTLPTSFGEKVVIRVLDSRSILRGLGDLGMAPETLETFKTEITRPHGIILVTGPTGSGKTTTLYSALNQMDGATMNVSTVEDPVEYHLGFTNQVQVNEKAGLSFAAALRSLLRQDPDIMMVGEIRDSETARIAVQAALTGHLVLSTLHTNDAPSSITRLVDIGIEPYLIAASLNSILAQRLVRKICPKCRQKFNIPETMREFVKNTGVNEDEIFHGAGCEACRNSGYQGRIGIYELLVIDDPYRDMITKDSSITNMRKAFAASEQASLYDDGIRKVKMGLTTLEEVLRVTEAYAHGLPPSAATEIYVSEPEHFKVSVQESDGPIQIIAPGAQKPHVDSDGEKLSFEEIAYSWEFQNENSSAQNSKITAGIVAPEQAAKPKPKEDSNIIYSGFHVEDWAATMGIWQVIDGVYTANGRGERRTFLQAAMPDDFKLTLEMTLFEGEGFGIWFRTDPRHLSGYAFQYDPKWDGGTLLLKRWVDGIEYFGNDIVSCPYRGAWYGKRHKVQLAACGQEISVTFDDEELLHAYDAQFSSGQIGLRLWDSSDTKFESFTIERFIKK